MKNDDRSPIHLTGLSESKAQARLAAEGANELPEPERRTPLRIVLEVLREPMFALLIGGGAIYLLLGDVKEALILLAFAMLSILITVVQESRTERVLDALRNLASPRALVIRDGVRKRIAGRDVVRGDLILLTEGDRVPADALLLEARDLQTDESLLTGESVPVGKRVSPHAARMMPAPGGEDSPYVYSGSLVVRGSGTAEILATGASSQMGRIGQLLHGLAPEPPRLQTETRNLVRLAAIGGGAISLVVMVLYGLFRGGWLEALLAGITIGMSMLPEEFPVVLTVFMAMGAWRISRARVLTRRSTAIEALGSATVLCTDKTGTLTENRMSVVELRTDQGAWRSGDPGPAKHCFQQLVAYGVLASAPEAFDPMERALHSLSNDLSGPEGHSPPSDARLVKTYGLRPELLAVTQIWAKNGEPLIVAAKGAPEAIGRLCRLSKNESADLEAAVESMAAGGMRVLAVAQAEHAGAELPDTPADFAFKLLGLVGFADPLRASVPAAVQQCQAAGIRIVMITGDYPATAVAIARQAGIAANEAVTGEMIDRQDAAALLPRVRSATIFARIVPEQKLRIVEALKADGQIVAMTGDGVNDAPSLKAAHIGIAMGGRGTDVAREASSIVLLDDDFGSIVTAIRLGRRIYDNLRKAMSFIVAVHVPIAGLALLPLLLGLPIIFSPIHIAFLELVIDPVCSLVFEAETEEEDVMRRPPRSPTARLLPLPLMAWGALQGALVFGMAGAMFIFASRNGMPDDEVRALTFVALIAGIFSLILVNRSFSSSLRLALLRPNLALLSILLGVCVILGLCLSVPALRELFRFGALHVDDLGIAIASALLILFALELLKPYWRTKLTGRRFQLGDEAR
ncbi:ATPase, E1-E2 type [Bradyrhizobium sp. STM 3843]|uniref:cation-translocating P-type ATPase n=1 Tax=Bradyrhizobium sp. STM 3843 TaxID=551947 RepID=UPI0002407217|nr:cation-translocating P-type ATPase [Bradyrhizobium sp. STM 3843]CCE06767.1 ATPase, E1-E2 type [Bradyrhizobium sp. STM 3843]